MDILALHLSPRQGGNSEILLDDFIEGAQSAGARVEKVSVSGRRIEPCTGCGACESSGSCILSDDMDELYPKLLAASKLVVSSSLFFYDVPAAGKALIDRVQPLWARRYTLKNLPAKPGAKGFLLALGATKGEDLFVPIHLTVKYFFDALGLPKKFDSLCLRQVEKMGDMASRQADRQKAREAGASFVKD